ncbi:anti-sigma-28 factor, FlgM family [Sphingomonas laterariae]|uniref:Anti-sigma-28 factor, FlgM family n=1 Tax=Edaphosphingomonas laterariae TaxID=861865 RepID=A0A239HU02_9SPHN|nr:flagellar biosynthesis anti-sigma factor FlgM [Sphingomonas laterariae]SNS84578.1 anti-sigma-28 factor, FlgM family [Sphingomonas laterariae]
MIDSIGPKATGRPEAGRTGGVQRGSAGGKVAAVPAVGGAEEAPAPANPAKEMAATGAPIDHARVQEVRAAIANGAYALEVKAIAAKMIALDLPPRG